jgi:hypothetical protein
MKVPECSHAGGEFSYSATASHTFQARLLRFSVPLLIRLSDPWTFPLGARLSSALRWL